MEKSLKYQKNNPYFDIDIIAKLCDIISLNYDQLFSQLGVDLNKTQKLYIGCCPIHGGDNPSAFNLYRDGYSVKGYWKCRTRHCEQVFKPTLIGFTRGVLSSKICGWSNPKDSDKVYNYIKTIDFLCQLIGIPINEITIDSQEIIQKKKFIAQINSFVKDQKKESQIKKISRNQVRNGLHIPSEMFIKRGFSAEILDKYDVGLCSKPNKEMSDRVVVPIYDNKHNYMVACTGRSIYEKCHKCNLYHNPELICPNSDKLKGLKYSKWKNSSNSNVNSYLYNYWFAKDIIKMSGVAVLVEGPPDVWKLESLGVHNSLAIFGTDLSDEQELLLEMSGALSIICLFDMDPPGRHACQEIKKKLEKSYNIYIPEYSAKDQYFVKDPGELTQEIIEQELLPLITSISSKKRIL